MKVRSIARQAGGAAVVAFGLVLVTVSVVAAHDMFVKPTRFFAPESTSTRRPPTVMPSAT